MPQITLKRPDVEKLYNFCADRELDQFFLAKDEGAYVGAAKQNEHDQIENCIFYFKGCDPKKDEDWYETARDKFGGDDFGEFFPVTILRDALEEPKFTKLVLNVSPISITIKTFSRK